MRPALNRDPIAPSPEAAWLGSCLASLNTVIPALPSTCLNDKMIVGELEEGVPIIVTDVNGSGSVTGVLRVQPRGLKHPIAGEIRNALALACHAPGESAVAVKDPVHCKWAVNRTPLADKELRWNFKCLFHCPTQPNK